MHKNIITLTLIFALPIIVSAQWVSKNIATASVLTCVHFLDNEQGYVTGGNSIYKTLNGGNTWITSYTAGNSVFFEEVYALNASQVIAVGKDFSTDKSVLLKTSNGGAIWENIELLSGELLRTLSFPSSQVGFCAGGGTILKTIDSGDSWEVLTLSAPGSILSIFFVDEMIGFAVGGSPLNAVMLKTIDGGQNWTSVDIPSDNYLQSVFFTSPNTGYVVGWNGEILKTTDAGAHWTPQNSVSMQGNLEIEFTDENTGYIVGGDSNLSLIQKTTNAGDLWENISPQVSNGLISIDFPSFNTGYAVGSNGTVVKTDSGGVVTVSNPMDNTISLYAYPNPVSEFLKLETCPENFLKHIRLFDSKGQFIREYAPNAAQCLIDFTNLESNIYYLEVKTQTGTKIQKVVKI